MALGTAEALGGASSSGPQISLVALVRDEAADLRRLLRWHRSLYDEAVVVDTGSRDDSRAVATAAGAIVTRFRWGDDFSAARNHGLSRASGRWILVLDCDELIAPEDFARVRQLCDAGPTAWEFTQRNYCGRQDDSRWRPLPDATAPAAPAAPGYIDVSTCRLFPRRQDIRYEGVVHEMPDASLRRAGCAHIPTAIVIHHYGHLASKTVVGAKNEQYAKLLRRKLNKQPEDPTTRYEMAVQLVIEGVPELARRLLARTVREAPQHVASHRARLLLGRLLLAEGSLAAGLQTLEDVVHQRPELADGWIDVSRAHARVGDPERAAGYLRQGLYLFPSEPALLALQREVRGVAAEIG